MQSEASSNQRSTDTSAGSSTARSMVREEIPERYRWQLADIYDDWTAWQAGYEQLDALIDTYAALAGSLDSGPDALLTALKRDDELGALSYRVWFYASLMHDEDQRDNSIDAKRQQVQILFAKAQQASAWFRPELLAIPLETVRGWFDQADAAPEGDAKGELSVYRFAVEEVYRQQEHVLDAAGEQLLSLGTRFSSTPSDAYGALTTADIRFPTITLSSGEEITVSYGKYRALLATCRVQQDRAAAFEALYGVYEQNLNTYAALYNGVCQRDLFYAQARRYGSTLEGALHGNDVPVAVVENLISATREGAAPLQRYHGLRKRMLGLENYHLYDGAVPLVELDRRYPYDDVAAWIVDSVAPLGADYQANVRRAFDERWIDVYENEGKRSGAYSAPVYGTHPYMLLNYNDTLDDVFTLAHEMGHSMHTILSHESQPFAYASYTIFVAEVASTLNEALLLDYLLDKSDDPQERALLLQHAIDGICGTFYTQVLFADWELAAHREVEQGKPLTAERLSALYRERLEAYYGEALTLDARYDATWSRIPHFFRTPYYVYQYATCFASSAKILADLRAAEDQAGKQAVVDRYLELLRAGSKDHPMNLLRAANVDLADTNTVRAVVDQLDGLVGQLEGELGKL
jgi:oligoendopeptidase F